MNAPVSRRSIVAGTAAALGAAALPVGIVEALTAEGSCTGLPTPPAFDPVAFLADLKEAGCRVHLSSPATVFRPEDEWPTYFISWPPQTSAFQGYCDVKAKWSDAMDACTDHVERVVAHLAQARETAS